MMTDTDSILQPPRFCRLVTYRRRLHVWFAVM